MRRKGYSAGDGIVDGWKKSIADPTADWGKTISAAMRRSAEIKKIQEKLHRNAAIITPSKLVGKVVFVNPQLDKNSLKGE